MGAGVCGGGACAETPTPSSQHHVVYTYRKPSKVSSCGEIGAEGVGFLFLDAGYDWSVKQWLTICLGTPKTRDKQAQSKIAKNKSRINSFELD